MTSPVVLVTGGAGFIGSNFIHYYLKAHPKHSIINLDALTYAGNLQNLKAIEANPLYTFIKGSITDRELVSQLFAGTLGISVPTQVIHFAAESHVDRSIQDSSPFIHTNVVGTQVLLDVAKTTWVSGSSAHRFVHVSTDEVYGSLSNTGYFTEDTPLAANSPYSASKAGSDLLVRSYYETFGFPAIITRCSNNYGPFQFPEKLIPLIINNILNEKPLPVYGKGLNVRDWLYVEDHCIAIDTVLQKGRSGEVYNIGGHNERKNIDIVRLLCKLVDQKLGRKHSS
ncbi:MAG: dTDP-glucose 4,6-dehydratase, partial [Candidatus Margulisiibacteriota bacterium]